MWQSTSTLKQTEFLGKFNTVFSLAIYIYDNAIFIFPNIDVVVINHRTKYSEYKIIFIFYFTRLSVCWTIVYYSL